MSRFRLLLDAVDDLIVERPAVVVLAFLVVTGGFAVGLGNVSTEAGTSQFTEDLPAQRAFETVDEKFTPSFGPDTGTTQLIQSNRNVLAKPSLLRMLEAQRRLEERPSLRVVSTRSAASTVASTLDPNATTTDQRIEAVEGATASEIDDAVRTAAGNASFENQLSDDFNPSAARATGTVAVVEHEVPAGVSAQAGADTASPLSSIQQRSRPVVDSVGGDVRVFGSGIVSAEFENVVFDSLILVLPASVGLILLFLIVAYRDPVDLLLGVFALGVTLVWTFGFVGLAGIAFSQILIAVPPLLLAVGIDFGIHSVNRYREERVEGRDVEASMSRASRQLLVAFFIVTGTTVVGFLSNVTSGLAPIREFGAVAAVGITFTFLIFGVLLPATKVLSDRARERRGLPGSSRRPIGLSGSVLGAVPALGMGVARRAPAAFLALVVGLSLVSGAYGLGVDTTFAEEDFLPPEETPAYLEDLPEPFRPSEYTVTRDVNYLDEEFTAAQGETVTVYVEGPMTRDYALESFDRAARDPPDSFVTDGRDAEVRSIRTVIRAHANESDSFRRLVDRNDVDDDGVPDDDLEEVYDALFDSPAGDEARGFLTEDRRAARVVYTTEAGASQGEVTEDAEAVADRYRFEATATGETVVFQEVTDVILASAIRSLALALAATAAFLVLVYYGLEGEPSLGLVNLVPIVVTVTLLAGSMRALDLPFNALTATILSITIGLGTDYSAHVVHRFADEYDGTGDVFGPLEAAVRGTGGALTGSMLTTTTGIGVLVLAVTPILGQFGALTALSVLYSYLTAVLVTPSLVVVREGVRSSGSSSTDRPTLGSLLDRADSR
ncbi:efflux RND transporter permease subunit [Halorarum salinum]|uniref:MMPL family transporter n=1 Tax=Halorarum salinum TaxID=2743089 RepID=A0A7D5QF39_9EURY|nr:MMPL family transporter [Halobaculum salinum]QLG61122.1 MMPL family transporter [Halobaculum salinum]